MRQDNTTLRQLIDQRGWSFRQIARLVNAEVKAITGTPGAYDGDKISELASGKTTWPRAYYRQALMNVFEVKTCADLGLYSKNAQPEHTSEGVALDPELASLISGLEVDDMRRRQILAILGLTAPLAVVLDTDQAMRTALAAASSSRTDDQTIRNISSILNAARELDDQLGPQAAIGTVRTQGMLADQLLRGCRDTVRPAMLSLRARIGIATGWQSYDLGDEVTSRTEFQSARDAALEAGDFEAVAYGLAEWSVNDKQATKGEAVERADDAERYARRSGDPLLRAHTAGIASIAHARNGDAASTRAAYDRAVSAIHTAPTGATPDQSLAYWAAPSTVYYHGAKALRLTGDLATANQAIIESLRHTAPRDRAFAHFLQAAIQVDTRDYDAAVDTTLLGLKDAGGSQSVRVTRRLEMLRTAIHSQVPGSATARDLDRRLSVAGVLAPGGAIVPAGVRA